MNLKQLLNEFSTHKESVQLVFNLLKEISRLDQNRMENLFKLKAQVLKLEKIIKQIEQGGSHIQNIADWVSQYKRTLETAAEGIRKRFGTELEQELKKLGIPLLGQYPELKAGLFTIELDFDKWKVTLWYGPKQERLSQHPLSTSKIAIQLEKEKKKLGSQLSEEQLLVKLREAYHRASGMKHGDPAPIIKVLAEMSYLLQKPRFLQDPRRENYRSYSRADFSYDLFRIRKLQSNTLFVSKLHLTVATRAHTRNRSGFLWVPDDESGKGTTYSHLHFEEGTK